MNLIFLSDIILVALALIALVVASYTDFKKREVANWISFSLIIVALILRGIIEILTTDSFLIVGITFGLILVFLFGFYLYLKNTRPWLEYIMAIVFIGIWYLFDQYLFFMNDYFISCFLTFGIFMILTNLMYYGKMSGGADVKMLLALSVVFATTPIFLNFNYNLFSPLFGFILPNIFLFDFFVNSLLAGLVFGIVFSIFMALRNKGVFSRSFKKLVRRYLLAWIIFIALGIVLLFLSSEIKFLLIFGILSILIPLLLVFVSSVQEACMKKLKSWKELTEGDWLVQNVRINKKIIKPSADGLTKKDILLIKKSGKKVLILDGMPFVPVFLIAVILSLIFGNLLFRILLLLV